MLVDVHGVGDRLDYRIDWSGWLADGETVTDHLVSVSGLELDELTPDGPAVTVWVSGGAPGTTARITDRIVTSQGREAHRSIVLVVVHR